jgi:hypothetical protein
MLATVLTVCFAKEGYFHASKQGWHSYQDPIKRVDENRTLEDEVFIASLPEELSSLSAEAFKKTEEKVRAIAAMKPTQENIMAWKRMVKFATDQSKVFTTHFKLASMMDDRYDYTDIGTGGFSQNTMKEVQKQKEKAQYLTENIVFVTFVQEGESMLAKKQIMANMDLKREFGVETRTFSVHDFPHMVGRLGLKDAVENFVFYKDTKQWQRIRRGLIDAQSYVNDFMFFEEHKDAFALETKNRMAHD